MRKFLCVLGVFLWSESATTLRQDWTNLSHVKMTLANAKSLSRQTLENIVRNAASEFTRRTAIASLASLRGPFRGSVGGQPVRKSWSCLGCPNPWST